MLIFMKPGSRHDITLKSSVPMVKNLVTPYTEAAFRLGWNKNLEETAIAARKSHDCT